jgi:hypothetical protein
MENYKEEFLPENYQQNEIKPNGIFANILCLVILIVLAPLMGFIYFKAWGTLGFQVVNIPIMQRIFNSVIIISILIVFLIIREIIQGMYWSKYTEVKIKVILKLLFRICYCKEPIKIKTYIKGLIMPTIILGVIPLIIGMFFGNIIVLGFGVLFIAAGSGDFLVMYLLRKENKENWIKDMDTTIGCIIYSLEK